MMAKYDENDVHSAHTVNWWWIYCR